MKIMTNNNPTLFIVVPCFNEQEALPESHSRLSQLMEEMIAAGAVSQQSRLLYVDDGSRDDTWEIINGLASENRRVAAVKLASNSGHQNALMAGLAAAVEHCDITVSIDADLQDDIECIPQMVRHFEEGNDIVYGVKVSRQADPFMKRMTAMAFYKLQNSMGVESVYNHADFRLMSKRALDMLADYKETNLYLRGLIPQIGLRSTTVDDVISERYAGASKYTLKKMLRLAFNGITAFSVKPMHAIFFLGVLFLIVAFFIGLYVIHALITRSAVPGWSSLILSVWLVGGFIILSIGIAGLYIGNIYNEVKHRPLYHIQEILD